jgi:hypothetical protein
MRSDVKQDTLKSRLGGPNSLTQGYVKKMRGCGTNRASMEMKVGMQLTWVPMTKYSLSHVFSHAAVV